MPDYSDYQAGWTHSTAHKPQTTLVSTLWRESYEAPRVDMLWSQNGGGKPLSCAAKIAPDQHHFPPAANDIAVFFIAEVILICPAPTQAPSTISIKAIIGLR